MREVGRVTGNVTSGTRPRSAKKVTDIFLFIFAGTNSPRFLTNDPISGDRR